MVHWGAMPFGLYPSLPSPSRPWNIEARVAVVLDREVILGTEVRLVTTEEKGRGLRRPDDTVEPPCYSLHNLLLNFFHIRERQKAIII